MRCPYCGSTVTPGAEACAQCEVRILWDGDSAKFQAPETYVPVFVASDPAMLPVIESLLSANDIPFVVPNETTQDFLGLGRAASGFNMIIGPPVVKVPGEQAAAARELIASATTAPSGEPEPGADTPEA